MIVCNLESCDLNIDEVYGGSRVGNAKDDPLPKLLGVDSGAGFRVFGKRKSIETLRLVVLVTSFKNLEWPDSLDLETGVFTYYGDRHEPGPLHQTPRDGNLILRNIFEALHAADRSDIPPILLFAKTGRYRDMRFLGLAVPGAEGMSGDEDLVAVWRIKNGQRFQNYKAIFSVLDVPVIPRCWLEGLKDRSADALQGAPKEWLTWRQGRRAKILRATPTKRIRKKHEQLPADPVSSGIVQFVRDYYQAFPCDFEKCALELARMHIGGIVEAELTRPWRDGGRDAFGRFRLGKGISYIDVEFALEAKLYSETNGVGVKEISRLISRLRYRQFGILVTTSYVSGQAFAEIIEDGHPVVVLTASDIGSIISKRFSDIQSLEKWLSSL